MNNDSEEYGGDTTQFGFNCPDCGDVNVIETENGPESIENRIYECEGCGENILLVNYVGSKEGEEE